MNQEIHPFSVLVRNEPGVLSRVAGLLSRRGFNIESLSVGETADPAFSRMTIIVRGSEIDMEQVRKQLDRLVEVVKVADLFHQPRLEMETALIKVAARASQWNRIIDTATRFQAQVADTGPRELLLAFAGSGHGLDDLVRALRPFGIMELARTGLVSMARCRKAADEIGRPNQKQETSLRISGGETVYPNNQT